MSYAKCHLRSGHILLIAIGVYLLLTAAYTGYVVHREKAEWVAELDHDLSKAARTIPFILEPGFFERVARLGAISEEEDLRNIDRLTRMADALGLAYLYTLSDVDGTVYITSSSASEEERQSGEEVRAFTPYPELAEEVRTTMASDTPHFRTYTDRWGTFRHVYIPLETSQGAPYILAADQSTEALVARLKPLIIQELSGPLFFVLVAIPFFLMYRIQLDKHAQHLQRVNREVAEAKERLETATEAGGIGIWDRDIVNDRLVWDERMYTIYAIRKEDFGGAYQAWQQSVHPEDLDRAKAEVAAAEQGKKEFDTEFRIIRPDGRVRFIHAHAKVIGDQAGKPLRMIGTNQDITERIESEAPFQMLFEGTPSGVAVYQPVEDNTNFVFVAMNPAGLRYANASREQIIGNKLTDCFPGVKESGIFDALHRVAETGETERVPLVQYQDERIEQWVENTIFRLPSGLVVAIFNDITEQRKLEQELMQFAWLIEKEEGNERTSVPPEYDDVTVLNENGLILSTVGKPMLENMTCSIMDLLDTCIAVYERNGDYAFGTFVSTWCGTLDNASRKLCRTENNREALNCGKWCCHESCWAISKEAIDSGKPVDRACVGGLRVYAVPIRAGDEIIGAINFGYGTPPDATEKLNELADCYQLSAETLRLGKQAYRPRPPFIIDVAKEHLLAIAQLIGQMVERTQNEEKLKESEERFSRMLGVVPDMISIHSPDMDILYSNWQGFGKVPEARRNPGTKCYKTYRDFDEACPDCMAKEVIQTKKPLQKEVQLPDGSWIDLRVIPLLNKDNAVEMFMEWVRDTTDRKKAEEELANHRAHLEEKVEERTQELRAIVNAMAGREVRMAELKEEIADLQARLNAVKTLPPENES